MRKILATFAIVVLFAPLVALADDSTAINSNLAQINMELLKIENQIGVLQQRIIELTTNMTQLVDANDLKLAQHITDETDPLKQSAPTILIIAMLVSVYFLFRGMNLIYRKVRPLKKQHTEERI